MSNGLVVLSGLGDMDVSGHVVVMIQQDMDLDPTLGTAETRPGEKTEAKGDGRGVKTHEFVFEAEFAFPSPAELASVTKTLQKHPEQALVECDRAVLVGVGERGPVGPFRNTEMFELAQAAGQAPADFPERIRMGEVAKQHGDELRPAAEPFGLVLSVVFSDQPMEF